MSKSFSRKWEERSEGLKGALRPSEPLKPQINTAVNRVEAQLSRINGYIDQYTARDKQIFEKIVHAYEKHDTARANMYANELAEIRKQKSILMHSKLSLDNAALRLRTVFEFGSVVSVLTSAVDTIQGVRAGLSGIMPEVSNELGQVQTALSDIVIEMGQEAGPAMNFDVIGEESEQIIREAAVVAESRMKNRFPEMPNDLSQGGSLVIRKEYDSKEK